MPTKRPPPPPPPVRDPMSASVPVQFGMPTPKLPPFRSIYLADPGLGKTTLGVSMPNPLVLMAPDEMGYLTLLGAGLAPQCETLIGDDGEPVPCREWREVISTIDHLIDNDTGIRTVFFDALSGFQHLACQETCDREFGGDWGESGFTAYQRGYTITAETSWRILLEKLNVLQAKRATNVVFAAHTDTKEMTDPTGPNYIKTIGFANKHFWQAMCKWSNGIYLLTFQQSITQADTKKAGKQTYTGKRVIRSMPTGGADAKNQYGLNHEIILPDDPKQAGPTLRQAILDQVKENQNGQQ